MAAIGAAVLVLGVGSWSAASAAPPLPLPLPPLPLPAPAQTYVTPDDLHGFDAKITGAGTRDFTDELGAPPAGGTDALKIVTPGTGDKVQSFTSELAGPLEKFESSSYYAKRDPASTATDVQFPSFQITVDKNGGEFQTGDFSTLSFEPVYQTGTNANQTEGTWNRYDTGTGVFCSSQAIGGFTENTKQCNNQGYLTLAEIAAENPGITVLSAGINQGSGNPGLTSAVDLLQVGTTTYNFERTAPVTPPGEPPNCEPPKEEHPDGWGSDEHPKGEHPKDDHSKGEHPKGEHPDGEHPDGEHPGGDDPKDECRTS